MNTSIRPFRPVAFVPHGSPMFALAPGAAGAAMRDFAAQFPAPRAIVVVSPHWETEIATVGNGAVLSTIHDFHGFDPRLYEIHYPATGCPEVAALVMEHLHHAGLPAASDAKRGLDHGAWVPLRQMFPDANVPVVPLSLQSHLGPDHAHRVGAALARLVDDGIFIVASGNITHNLNDWHVSQRSGHATPGYVQQFADWVCESMAARDIDGLMHYRSVRADGVRAHPTEEHLLPLFTALGAAGARAIPEPFYRGISDGVLAMDAYGFR